MACARGPVGPCVAGTYSGISQAEPTQENPNPNQINYTLYIEQDRRCRPDITGWFELEDSDNKGDFTGIVIESGSPEKCIIRGTSTLRAPPSGQTEWECVLEMSPEGKWNSISGTFQSDWGTQGSVILRQQ